MNTSAKLSSANARPTPADPAALAAALARSIAANTLELPGFPEVSLRVQKLLSDESVSSERIVQLLGAEPLLAARVMSLANAAAMNASSTPIKDLRNAMTRLGFDSLRAVAVAFAVAQIQRAPRFQPFTSLLSRLWQQSVRTASCCWVIAKSCGRVSPDTALFTGLVAGVGKLYILTYLLERGAAADAALLDHPLFAAQHTVAATALLEHWQVAADIVEAVGCYESLITATRAPTVLADVLALAQLFSQCYDAPANLTPQVEQARSAERLGLNAAVCGQLLAQAKAELAALRSALGH